MAAIRRLKGIDTRTCHICHEQFDEEPVEAPLTLHCGHTFGSVCITNWLNKANEPGCPLCRVDAWQAKPRQKDKDIEDAALYGLVEGQTIEGLQELAQALVYYKLKKLDVSKLKNGRELKQQQLYDCVSWSINYYVVNAWLDDKYSPEGDMYQRLGYQLIETFEAEYTTRLQSIEKELIEAIRLGLAKAPRLNVPMSQRMAAADRLLAPGLIVGHPSEDVRVGDRYARSMVPRLMAFLSRVREWPSDPVNFPVWRPDVEAALEADLRDQTMDLFAVNAYIMRDLSHPLVTRDHINQTLQSWGVTNFAARFDRETGRMYVR
ncbi:uncharacterized protein KY384_005068 [Bacidia gigantensis]|uniref:uncharacterized protein n=1 Tax=Bacidia gigantensis TaxID=2732470 RepID=UPI001D04B2FB|nr:uncharacterized protein KY384_005068 [Bacidia gigantensis]KAG8530565.1 hypothetical protein KY384_005068 [Bacidia gigantensis]